MKHLNLLRGYTQAGIIQFGRFVREDGRVDPLDLNFLLLPSYPALLRETATALAPHLQQAVHKYGIDRLLSTRATTALGGVLAVQSNIPLTYPYGEAREATNAYLIEGAYDIAHPTALLAYILDADTGAALHPAQTVGLPVRVVLSLFELGTAPRAALIEDGLEVITLFDLRAALDAMAAESIFPPGLRAHLDEWLAGFA
ncbi:MAG: hypothetical protein ACLFTK_03930 [Anaerolineales bacterium]